MAFAPISEGDCGTKDFEQHIQYVFVGRSLRMTMCTTADFELVQLYIEDANED